MPTLTGRDITAIELALNHLPLRCRYHGDKVEGAGFRAGRACCDTGEPSLARKRAEAALKRAVY